MPKIKKSPPTPQYINKKKIKNNVIMRSKLEPRINLINQKYEWYKDSDKKLKLSSKMLIN
jgi:hypothetical protein